MYKNLILPVLFSLASSTFFVPNTQAEVTRCRYSFLPKNSSVKVTGYKFSSKKGVTGQFSKFEVPTGDFESLGQLISNTNLKASFSDFDSGNKIRTQNIMETLLFKLSGFSGVEASVKSINDSKVDFELVINGKKKKYQWPWKIVIGPSGPVFSMVGPVVATDFLPKGNFRAFAKRCEGLHRGPDGVSKTWSVLDVEVSAAILKVCK